MCVAVTLAPGTDLTLQEVERMNRANADGVGVAWAKDGVVQWYKTTKVDPNYVVNMIAAWKEVPRLVHFRFATAGGTRPELCHPFEVGPRASCRPVGHAPKVMIHNGHWGRWNEVKDLLDKENLLPDNGPWSDTRLAAYLAHMDPDWLSALGGRVAVMTGDGETHRLGDWQELRTGIYVSNKSWDTDSKYTRGGYAGYRTWKGWHWTEDEMQAFFEDEEKRESEALLLAVKEADERKQKAKADRGKDRKTRREEKRAASREVDGTTALRQDAACETSSPGAAACVGKPGDTCATCESGRCVCSPAKVGFNAGYLLIEGRKYPLGPWFNDRNRKWYRTISVRGRAEVVEVAAPNSDGPASS
jgi:hypothetical protein